MTGQYKYIEELIERFLDGTTTNAEEKELYAFFAGKDVPAHLEQYVKMFAWFDGGLPQELETDVESMPKIIRPKNRFRIWGTVAAVAATLVLLMVLRPQSTETEFDPFEGSYIVRNGVKITDPEVIRSELEATLEDIRKEEEEQFNLLFAAYESEMKNMIDEWERSKEVLEYINSFPEGEARQEVIGILLTN